MTRYRIIIALTSLVLVLSPRLCHPEVQMRSICLGGRAGSAALYSARAIRRTKVLLQLELLVQREARLERARAAVMRQMSIDQLVDPHPTQKANIGGAAPSNLKQRQAFATTKCL